MRVLVVNTGSTSLKLSVLTPEVASAETVERWDGELGPLRQFLARAGEVDVVGHRVVHGGSRYTGPARIDKDLVGYLESIEDLSPLHNPRAVAGIRVVGELLPRTPAVACFDTAFHATLPPAAYTYAVPREWNARWDLRRYGFHGLSHTYAARRAAELIGKPPADLRVVSCHLGAGSSLAAIRDGRSCATTMGFTPLAGLVMATRSGDVDPGLLLWLLRHGGMSVDDLDHALEHDSGLRGLSGTSGDLRDVLAGRERDDPDCALAFDVFIHHLTQHIAAMAAAIGGLDVLVMTGGVGEHAPLVRSHAAERLGFLGVRLDTTANEQATGDADISDAHAAVSTVVVTAREDLAIYRQVTDVITR